MQNLIGGAWVDSPDGATLAVTDPATDECIDAVPDGGPDHFRAAVDAAVAALPAWASVTARARSELLSRVVADASDRAMELATCISRESGKPIRESEGEVRYALGFLEWAAAEGLRVNGETLPSDRPEQRILVQRQPIGSTASITPWNFPLAMITRKVGPALAAGCTQVVKPAEEAPLSALLFGEMAMAAGVPSGVLNIVTGDAPAFSEVVFGDPRVRKVSFTGSTEVGRSLIRASADNVTKLSLELGGHSPVIVLEDADLDTAVAMTMAAKFRNAGQSCVAAGRARVARSRYEEFCGALVDAMKELTLGYWDTGSDLGPLINDGAISKVRRHVEDAMAKGADLRCGGSVVAPALGLVPRFVEPTLLTGVTDEMLVCTEETFGPVLAVGPYDDLDEAIAGANASPYGLAGYVAGRDAGVVLDVADRLECGVVGINDGVPSTPQAPFGGMKQSGIGREGGRYVMDEYLETKYISLVV